MTKIKKRQLVSVVAAATLLAAAGLGLPAAKPADAAQQSPPLLEISSPASGTVVNPGQTITVTVDSPANATFQTVAVIGPDPIGGAGPANSVPAQFSLTIPTTVNSLMNYSLTAVGVTPSSNQLAQSDPILIDVERPDMPTAISQVDHKTPGLIFRAIGQQLPILLLATFSDGSMIEVTRSSYVAYSSSNTSIATVNANGIVTAAGAGQATITATYTLNGQNVSLAIPVTVNSRGVSVSPNSPSDFGSENVGTSGATQQLTVTDATLGPVTISPISTTGDFSETDNCASSSPLAPQSACTIAVTFTPTVGGARTGSISIGNNFTAIPTVFPLSGTGVEPTPSPPIVSFAGAPASGAYQSTFTVSATTNASATAVITASGACTITGNTVTMTSGTGTCSLTANWAADSNYLAASATQSTAAQMISPTVSFTGAPASASYQSMFAVSATTSASTTAVITASGACTIAGNTVTMTSGTGTCNLVANWAADGNYPAASALQSATATKVTSTINWAAPPAITHGTALSRTQLNATANVAGTFAYTPAAGTVLPAGTSTLSVTFTPTASSDYTTAAASVPVTVNVVGNLTISSGQTYTFANGTITGNLVMNGGTLVLDNSAVGGNLQMSGGSLVLTMNGTVKGNLQITGGGTFSIGPGQIGGNLQIQNIPAGPAQNQICSETVTGNLQFQNNGTAVLIGSPSCPGNTVGGNLQVSNNSAAVQVEHNSVGNNLQVQNNTASTAVFSNAVNANLQCSGNSSSLITGGGNTAAQKQGQCAGF